MSYVAQEQAGRVTESVESRDKSSPVGPTISGFHILVGLTLVTFVVDLVFLAMAVDMALATSLTPSRAAPFTGMTLLGASAVLVMLAAVPGLGALVARRRAGYHS